MNAVTVLVVGAGPTGLTLAQELRRHGVAVRLIEKALASSPLSRALAIHARTLEVFGLMGVVEEFLVAGERISGAALHSGPRTLARIGFGELDTAYPFILILPQSETERLLGEALRRRGGTVERGVELVGLAPRAGEGSGALAVLRHPDGRNETVEAEWVVGCDGAHSAVRHLAGIPFLGAPYPEPFFLADVRIDPPPNREWVDVHLEPQGLVALFPLPEGRMRIVASRPFEQESDREATLGDGQAILDARLPGRYRLSDPAWIAGFRIHHRCATALRQGPFFLAGDAAHIHSPAGGQGMNTGIQDAFNLAWKIALVARGVARPALLDSYGEERLPVVRQVIRQTDLLTRQALLRGPFRWLRDRLLPLAAARPFVRHRIARALSQIGLRYRSAFVEEHGSGPGPRAGERAPELALRQAAGSGAARLSDFIARGGFTLLLVGGEGDGVVLAEAAAVARRRLPGLAAVVPCGVAVEGEEGWLPAREGAPYGSAAAVYLIRPDGYVGFRAPAVGAAGKLDAYLDRYFGPEA